MAKPKFQQSNKPSVTEVGPIADAIKAAAAPVVNTVAPVGSPKTVEEVEKFTAAQLITTYGSKSNAIRGLAALGMKPGPISKKLGIIYQHARNVLKRPLKKPVGTTGTAAAATPGTTAERATTKAA